MQSVTLQEAQSRLAEIIDNLPPGTEVVITRDDKPVAAIRAVAPTPRIEDSSSQMRREPQISAEEIERRLRQSGGRSLAEILADLEKKA